MTFTELEAVELTSSDRDRGTQYNSTDISIVTVTLEKVTINDRY